MRTLTHAHTHAQIKNKSHGLGTYAVQEDAAAARDVIAKVLGRPLNFQKPREITGQRSKNSETRVADAAKAANAFVLGSNKKPLIHCHHNCDYHHNWNYSQPITHPDHRRRRP